MQEMFWNITLLSNIKGEGRWWKERKGKKPFLNQEGLTPTDGVYNGKGQLNAGAG